MAFTRIGSIPFNSGETPVVDACIDQSGGYIYWLVQKADSVIVKMRISDFTITTRLTITGLNATGICCNSTNIFVVGLQSGYHKFKKVSIATFLETASVSLTAQHTGTSRTAGVVVNSAGTYSYVCYNWNQDESFGGALYKVDTTSLSFISYSGPFTDRPILFDSDTKIYAISTDFVYQDSSIGILNASTLAVISSKSLPSEISTYLQYDAARNLIWIIDNNTGYYYLDGGWSFSSVDTPNLITVNMYSVTSGYSLVKVLAVDSANSAGYLISYLDPIKIHKFNLSSPSTLVDSLTLNSGDSLVNTAILDGVAGVLYIVDKSTIPDIIKVTVGTAEFLGIPTDLEVACNDIFGNIQLDFISHSFLEDGHKIERSIDSSSWEVVATLTTPTTTWTDSSRTARIDYFYRVRAYKGTNYSDYSSVTNTMCDWIPFTPEKPTWLRAVKSLDNLDNIITWYYNLYDNCGNIRNDIDGFKIYRKASTDSIYTLVQTITDTSVRTWTDAAVGGVVYTYKLLAYNSHRDSGLTDAVAVDLGTPTNFYNGEYLYNGTIDYSGN